MPGRGGGNAKRKRSGGGDDRNGGQGRRKQWRGAGNGQMGGQGIILTCNRGKEKRAANELVDMLVETAERLHPELDLETLPVPVKVRPPAPSTTEDGEEEAREEVDMDELANGGPSTSVSTRVAQPEEGEENEAQQQQEAPAVAPRADDIEAELRAELAGLKENKGKSARVQGPSKGRNAADQEAKFAPPFRIVETGTECLIYIQFHPALDPFELTYGLLEEVERTGEARSRIISRLTPVCGFASATQGGIEHLARQYLGRWFKEGGEGTFKIEPRIRSNNTLARNMIIDTVASFIPKEGRYRAELKAPELWVAVEVHKAQAALGVCRDFLRYAKLNPLELATAVRGRREAEEQERKKEAGNEGEEEKDDGVLVGVAAPAGEA